MGRGVRRWLYTAVIAVLGAASMAGGIRSTATRSVLIAGSNETHTELAQSTTTLNGNGQYP